MELIERSDPHEALAMHEAAEGEQDGEDQQSAAQFTVDSAEKANWVVRKIVASRAYRERVKQWAADETARSEKEEERLFYLFGRQLEAWARGEIDQLDERADVYSLGTVLHFLLKDQPKVSKAAKAICLKARASAKENRYSSASELSVDIGRLLDAEPVSAYRENAFEKVSRWVSKNRFLVLLVLAYLLMRIFFAFTSRR